MYYCFLHNAVITSDEVLVIATGVNSLLVAWWSSKATLVMRYSVFCSSLHAQVQTNKAEAEQNVEQFNDSAINSLSVNNRVPRTTYNCCVAEYSIDNSYSIVCKMATTLSAASQQGNMTNVNRTVGAAISLFVMLLITLLCTSILSLVAMRQRQDGKRIQKW